MDLGIWLEKGPFNIPNDQVAPSEPPYKGHLRDNGLLITSMQLYISLKG